MALNKVIAAKVNTAGSRALTKEFCMHVASQYATPSDLRRADCSVYNKCRDSGWLRAAYPNATPKPVRRRILTKELCREVCSRHSTLEALKAYDNPVYSKILVTRWVEEFYPGVEYTIPDPKPYSYKRVDNSRELEAFLYNLTKADLAKTVNKNLGMDIDVTASKRKMVRAIVGLTKNGELSVERRNGEVIMDFNPNPDSSYDIPILRTKKVKNQPPVYYNLFPQNDSPDPEQTTSQPSDTTERTQPSENTELDSLLIPYEIEDEVTILNRDKKEVSGLSIGELRLLAHLLGVSAGNTDEYSNIAHVLSLIWDKEESEVIDKYQIIKGLNPMVREYISRSLSVTSEPAPSSEGYSVQHLEKEILWVEGIRVIIRKDSIPFNGYGHSTPLDDSSNIKEWVELRMKLDWDSIVVLDGMGNEAQPYTTLGHLRKSY